MSVLVLELRAGETMIINGAPIRFPSRTRIELMARARFLFGKQLMTAEEATTTARQVYYALQVAYVGAPEDQDGAMADARRHLAALRSESACPDLRGLLDEAISAAEADDHYRALRLVRRMIRDEEAQQAGQAAE